jgi:hypothetical protein
MEDRLHLSVTIGPAKCDEIKTTVSGISLPPDSARWPRFDKGHLATYDLRDYAEIYYALLP